MKCCSVVGCLKLAEKKGMCGKHYQKQRKQGLRDLGRTCSVKGCVEPILSVKRELCSIHSDRFWKHGDTSYSTNYGNGYINKAGYRILCVDGKYIAEHRLLAERQLGFRLQGRENVHHRNGKKADNTIGPCLRDRGCDCPDGPHNLEFWFMPQLHGQRLSDLLDQANALFVRHYGFDVREHLAKKKVRVWGGRKQTPHTITQTELQLDLL